MPIPKKKPNYDSHKTTDDLLMEVKNFYGEAYDDRNDANKNHESLRTTADHFHITIIKARKLLITAGMYSTQNSRNVQALLDQGMDVQQIMIKTGLSRSSVHSYIPYSRVVYNMSESSLEAERQRQYRVRKKNEKLTIDEIENDLWAQLVYLQGCVFTTSKGLDFTYQIKGGEMFISRKNKSITRATVIKAYRESVALGGIVSGPKKLGTFGASYLFPIFKRIGIVK